MSLSLVHLIFVAASILLSWGLGVGLLMMFRAEGGALVLLFGLLWLVLGGVLVVYGRAVLRKLKALTGR